MSRRLNVVIGMIAVAFGLLLINSGFLESRFGIMRGSETRLSWDTPSEISDDSPLGSLAGYTIHCWNSINHLTEIIVIDDPEITSLELRDLSPGTYQCAVAAIDAGGHQSALSNVVSRTVP